MKELGIKDVAPSPYGLGGDVMSKAFAQKHRAVSSDTVLNTQFTKVSVLVNFYFGSIYNARNSTSIR